MTLLDLQHAADYVLSHWHVIAAYAGGGLTISALLQIIKRHFKLDKIRVLRFLWLIKIDGARLVVLLLTLFTTLGTAINWLIDPINAQYLPKQFAFLLTAAFFVHRFVVSPVGIKIEKILRPYWQALKEIKDSEERKSVIADGTTTVVTPQLEFSSKSVPDVAPFTIPSQGGK